MDWTNITKDAEVKQLLQQRKQIEDKIRAIDENALIMYELEVLSIPDVSGSYGCPNCGSKDIEEIGNNHHQTKDEMEYLEYCRCLKCKYEFVE